MGIVYGFMNRVLPPSKKDGDQQPRILDTPKQDSVTF